MSRNWGNRLPKAEWETMRGKLDETYRLVGATLKTFKTSASRTKWPEHARHLCGDHLRRHEIGDIRRLGLGRR